MNDGGPAFPHDAAAYASCPRCGTRSSRTGMSLRDWFAGMALQGLLARTSLGDYGGKANIAIDAYAMADAMLAERSKQQ